MKIALITDQHLDGRKGSLAFWNYFEKFYEEIFFPTLERKGIKTIIDLGDTFDNRKSIDFNVWSRIRRSYFDRLARMDILLITCSYLMKEFFLSKRLSQSCFQCFEN